MCHHGVFKLWLLVLCRISATYAAANTSTLRGSVELPPTTTASWPVHSKLVLALNGTLENNQWIIVFRDQANIVPQLLTLGKVHSVLKKALNAVVVSGLSKVSLEWLLNHDDILLIEQVRFMQ